MALPALAAALMAPEVLAVIASAGIEGLGGLFDDTKEKQLKLMKEQLGLSRELGKGNQALQAGDFLSRLITQRQNLQNQGARAAGTASAFGG